MAEIEKWVSLDAMLASASAIPHTAPLSAAQRALADLDRIHKQIVRTNERVRNGDADDAELVEGALAVSDLQGLFEAEQAEQQRRYPPVVHFLHTHARPPVILIIS